MAPLLAAQPLKAIYTIFIVLTVPVRATYLYLKYLVKPRHPQWNARMSLSSALLELFFHYSTVTRSRHVLDDDPKKAKERFVQIEPPSTNIFSGVLAPTGPIKPEPVKGVWLPSLPPNNSTELKKEKVVLHFPGGGFVVTFGHESSGRPITEMFTQHLGATRVLWSYYRLAESEETRFPAAVQDALTFYRYALSLGYEPENIILSGDSAGGNVVLALLRYLEASKLPDLPPPGAVNLFSPWVSVTAGAGAAFETCDNHKSDYLNGPFLQWGAESYLPSEGLVPADVQPYISPIHHPFQTSVPVFIWAGAAEAFFTDSKIFADEMAGIQGNKVRFHAQEKAAHDLLMNLSLFPSLEEGFHAALKQARTFFNNADQII